MFNIATKAVGDLFHVDKDVLLNDQAMWVGGFRIRDEVVMASAVRTGDSSFIITFGTSVRGIGGLGYTALIVRDRSRSGSAVLTGTLTRDGSNEAVLPVVAQFVANADGTHRLNVRLGAD
ncbi:hypothetical protein [Burkholderia cenocepacia]|uniref:hypothetical protein n=1 Tax=Burkholderia cenocepacia TaxID=95486 RepID=UPI000F57561D|nr:hypothetical protein [Burkholderia cenocepacia]